MNRDDSKRLDERIENAALSKFGDSVFDYHGADTDAPSLIKALIRMAEYMEGNHRGEGLGYQVKGSTAEFIAALAAEQIIFARMERRSLSNRIKELEAELAKLKGETK